MKTRYYVHSNITALLNTESLDVAKEFAKSESLVFEDIVIIYADASPRFMAKGGQLFELTATN